MTGNDVVAGIDERLPHAFNGAGPMGMDALFGKRAAKPAREPWSNVRMREHMPSRP